MMAMSKYQMPKATAVPTDTFIRVPQRISGRLELPAMANSPTVTFPSSRCLYSNRPKNLLETAPFLIHLLGSPHPPFN